MNEDCAVYESYCEFEEDEGLFSKPIFIIMLVCAWLIVAANNAANWLNRPFMPPTKEVCC